jgi:hypothetical protein
MIGVGLLLWLIIATSRDPFDLEQRDGGAVVARIASLSNDRTRTQGKWPGLRVSARTNDGAYGQTTALPADLAGCKVGDRIGAKKVGLRLYLEPQPCK